jgi:1A family penicillin-binding protein
VYSAKIKHSIGGTIFISMYKKLNKKFFKKLLKKENLKTTFLIGLVSFFIFTGIIIIWITSFELPSLDSFEERRVVQSTKIYDRTGEIILFDVHGDINRTVVPYEDISDYVKFATIAIEDANFYNHNGIEIKSIVRAILNNIKDGDLLGGQGGSTITQQVIKNALLTTDKEVSRKIKEWVLAPRLENILTKDQILNIYLNEVPYGGTVYGVQEATRRFFSKDAKDLSVAEAAYLAALPQAPTYFSPYGGYKEELETRKTKVIQRMFEHGFITEEEFNTANNEQVVFQKQASFGIKAPHFVMYIKEQLEEEYGKEAVEQGGLKVITTLDWELQEKAEEIVNKHALANKEKFDAENGAIVAVDPKTGQILTMVGSRDYFDNDIDGNFNITTAKRQPGSSFKPFVYAEAFNKGYRPETVVFDLATEFSTTCESSGECYKPVNYDGKYNGPMSLRNALAQSVNVPAIKVLYLAGLRDSLKLAKNLGIGTLTNVGQYGLTLVLGGGEVRPIDMASAYAVFANDGVKRPHVGILSVEDQEGEVLEEYKEESARVLNEQTSRLISDVLSDNVARAPVFGSNSYLNFRGRDVAAKTGTTNDYRDAWIVGYTPSISVAAWAGNNDNSSMSKKAAGSIVAPMWNEYMQFALNKYPGEPFQSPEPMNQDVKPIIRGEWQTSNIHSILHYVDKNNPLGDEPNNPGRDPQYGMWEEAVSIWSGGKSFSPPSNNSKTLSIISPDNGKSYFNDKEMVVSISFSGDIKESEVILNGQNIGEIDPVGKSIMFIPNNTPGISDSNTVQVNIVDGLGNSHTDSIQFDVL